MNKYKKKVEEAERELKEIIVGGVYTPKELKKIIDRSHKLFTIIIDNDILDRIISGKF